jgi:phage shock protein A
MNSIVEERIVSLQSLITQLNANIKASEKNISDMKSQISKFEEEMQILKDADK